MVFFSFLIFLFSLFGSMLEEHFYYFIYILTEFYFSMSLLLGNFNYSKSLIGLRLVP